MTVFNDVDVDVDVTVDVDTRAVENLDLVSDPITRLILSFNKFDLLVHYFDPIGNPVCGFNFSVLFLMPNENFSHRCRNRTFRPIQITQKRRDPNR